MGKRKNSGEENKRKKVRGILAENAQFFRDLEHILKNDGYLVLPPEEVKSIILSTITLGNLIWEA